MSVPTILQHCGQAMTIVQSRMKCLICGYEMPTPGAAGLGEEHIKHCGVDMAVARSAKCNICGYEMEDIFRIGETVAPPRHPHAAGSQPDGISPRAFGDVSVSGQTLNDRYQIAAAIGKGAMGEVYRATDAQTGQAVAVKILNAQYAFDAEMIERFRREGEALQQLRHPNIVGLVDTFQHEGRQVIVLEFVPDGSLHALLKREAPLDLPRVRRIALELCDALTRAHHLGIIHRDIKPENVLMAEDGTPRLTDFGVARLVGDATRLTGTGTQIGTPYYMSPEAWEGKPLDAQSDIWSLGVMLYEMVSGQVPFGGETLAAVMNKVLTASLPDLRSVRPETPDGLAQIIERMVTRDRSARYQSMREAAADLERGRPLEARRPPEARRALPVWVWALGGLILLACAALSVGGIGLWAASLAANASARQPADSPVAENNVVPVAATSTPSPTASAIPPTSTPTFTSTFTATSTPTLTPTPAPPSAYNVSVTLLQIRVHDDADPFAAGEPTFYYRLNELEGEWPGGGRYASIESGGTLDVNVTRELQLGPAESLSLYMNGTDIDDPTLFDPNDPMGVVETTYDLSSNFGAGRHEDRSTCPDGCYTLVYEIAVEPAP